MDTQDILGQVETHVRMLRERKLQSTSSSEICLMSYEDDRSRLLRDRESLLRIISAMQKKLKQLQRDCEQYKYVASSYANYLDSLDREQPRRLSMSSADDPSRSWSSTKPPSSAIPLIAASTGSAHESAASVPKNNDVVPDEPTRKEYMCTHNSVAETNADHIHITTEFLQEADLPSKSAPAAAPPKQARTPPMSAAEYGFITAKKRKALDRDWLLQKTEGSDKENKTPGTGLAAEGRSKPYKSPFLRPGLTDVTNESRELGISRGTSRQATMKELFKPLGVVNSSPNRATSEAHERPVIHEDPAERTKFIGPSYPHVEVVRKRAERQTMKGYECDECNKYWEAVTEQGGKVMEASLGGCSRHRSHFDPYLTPPHIWEVGFKDSDL